MNLTYTGAPVTSTTALRSPTAGTQGICPRCKSGISDRTRAVLISVPGTVHKFHPDCWRCYGCFRLLLDNDWKGDLKRMYCVPCWRKMNPDAAPAPKEVGMQCFRCTQPIAGTAVNIDDKYLYHAACFTCWDCTASVDRQYGEIQGKVYCPSCYVKRQAPPCCVCHDAIATGGMQAFGRKYHRECFKCLLCTHVIDTGKFVDRGGQPVCVPCASADYQQQAHGPDSARDGPLVRGPSIDVAAVGLNERREHASAAAQAAYAASDAATSAPTSASSTPRSPHSAPSSVYCAPDDEANSVSLLGPRRSSLHAQPGAIKPRGALAEMRAPERPLSSRRSEDSGSPMSSKSASSVQSTTSLDEDKDAVAQILRDERIQADERLALPASANALMPSPSSISSLGASPSSVGSVNSPSSSSSRVASSRSTGAGVLAIAAGEKPLSEKELKREEKRAAKEAKKVQKQEEKLRKKESRLSSRKSVG